MYAAPSYREERSSIKRPESQPPVPEEPEQTSKIKHKGRLCHMLWRLSFNWSSQSSTEKPDRVKPSKSIDWTETDKGLLCTPILFCYLALKRDREILTLCSQCHGKDRCNYPNRYLLCDPVTTKCRLDAILYNSTKNKCILIRKCYLLSTKFLRLFLFY